MEFFFVALFWLLALAIPTAALMILGGLSLLVSVVLSVLILMAIGALVATLSGPSSGYRY